MSGVLTPIHHRRMKQELINQSTNNNLNIDKAEKTPTRSRKVTPTVNESQTAWDNSKEKLIDKHIGESRVWSTNEENGSHNRSDGSTYLLGPPERASQQTLITDFPDRKFNVEKIKKNNYISRLLCPPYFIIIAGLIEIGVFLWEGEITESVFIYSPHLRHQVWRFFSYMLLHSSGTHLTLNIIIQTLLATPIEWEQGWWRCAVVYIGGGLAGGLGASMLQPTLFMVGASAGVYALLISHLANVLLGFSELSYCKLRVLSVGLLAASDIAFSVAHWWSAREGTPRIGWAAHCAGAAAGALLGLLVYKGSDEDKTRIKIMRWISFCIIILSVFIAVIFNIFFVKLS